MKTSSNRSNRSKGTRAVEEEQRTAGKEQAQRGADRSKGTSKKEQDRLKGIIRASEKEHRSAPQEWVSLRKGANRLKEIRAVESLSKIRKGSEPLGRDFRRNIKQLEKD